MPSMPVGLTRDLPAGRVMHAEVDEVDVVVWRAANGEIAAWNNRCPHRGMALSHGFVRGNSLACLYHGWHYERSGRCSYIPAHPDLEPPATIHATKYAIAEEGGVIWVAIDGDASGSENDLDPLRSMIVDASGETLLTAASATALGGGLPDAGPEGQFSFGADVVRLLCNALGENRTQVTVLASPALPVPRRRALSRWCEAMRRLAEKGGAS